MLLKSDNAVSASSKLPHGHCTDRAYTDNSECRSSHVLPHFLPGSFLTAFDDAAFQYPRIISGSHNDRAGMYVVRISVGIHAKTIITSVGLSISLMGAFPN